MAKATDRIFEAYFDEMGEKFGIEVRERIHWICEMVKGDRVLDIGCSQGIAPIILAREGRNVTGVDIEQDAIDFASSRRSEELETVQEKLDFVCDDFLNIDFGSRKFDSIILGEVLEHLSDPIAFVEKSHKLLVPDGTLIVTVPFGINDYFDHKRTYYFSGVFDLLTDYFQIVDIRYFGNWVGFLSERTKKFKRRSRVVQFDYVKDLEKAFLNLERINQEKVRQLSSTSNIANGIRQLETNLSLINEAADVKIKDSIASLGADFTDASTKLRADQESALKQQKDRIAKLENTLSDVDQKLEGRHVELGKQLNIIANLETEIRQKSEQLARLEQKHTDLQRHLASLEKNHSSLQQEHSNLGKDHTSLQHEHTNLSKDHSSLQQEHTNRSKDHSSLQQEHTILVKDHSSLQQEHTNLVKDHSSLQQEHTNLVKDHSSLQQEHTILAKDHFNHQQEHSGLKAKLRKKSKKLRFAKQSIQDLDEAVAELNRLMEAKNLLQNGLHEQLDALSRSNKILEEKRAGLEEKFKIATVEINSLRDRLASKQEDLSRARSNLEAVHNSVSWKITVPFRFVLQSLIDFRRGTRVLFRKLGPGHGKPANHADSGSVSNIRSSPASAESAIQLLGETDGRESSPRSENLTVAAIMDEFTRSCFEPECNLIPFRPDNWREVLAEALPDLLFVESAWNGNDGSWQYRVAEYPAPPGDELTHLIGWCKSAGIPTVFWNKEDPSHFNQFIKTACLFDWIFTSDSNCIERYQDHCGHRQVHAMPFAAQPAIHHPVLSNPRDDKVCFAGTWYGDRFDSRRDAMETLLRPAMQFDFDIYDRMHGAVGPGTENYRFPDEYQPHIVGRLNYRDMVSAYRQYRVFLNVNSVTDSPTMLARRVFELLACGTPVISTPSLGISSYFPDIVPIVNRQDEAGAALSEIMTDDEAWLRKSMLGLRRVMSEHTYRHRFENLCKTIGLPYRERGKKKIVVVVLPGTKPRVTAQQLVSQILEPVRILIIKNHHGGELKRRLKSASSKHVKIQLTDGGTGNISIEDDEVVALVDGNHTYGPGYLEDGATALEYSGADSTSMTTHFQLKSGNIAELNPELGDFSVLTNRVLGACFIGRADSLPNEDLKRLLTSGVLQMQEGCYARGPYEFLAGATLPWEDPRVQQVILADKFHD